MAEKSQEELRRDHEMIDLLSRTLYELIAEQAGPSALANALDALVTLVRDHLDREDSMIYTLAMRALPGIAETAIIAARAEFERLKIDWQHYLTLWDERAIAADSLGFARASRAMLPRLSDRIRLEQQLLVAIALQRVPESHAAAK
jgi:hypothetical protein